MSVILTGDQVSQGVRVLVFGQFKTNSESAGEIGGSLADIDRT